MERKSKCCLATPILALDIVDENNIRVMTCNLCGKPCEIVTVKQRLKYKIIDQTDVEEYINDGWKLYSNPLIRSGQILQAVTKKDQEIIDEKN